MIPAVTLISSLVSLVPSIADLVKNKSVEDVADIVQKVTGKSSPDEALEFISNNPHTVALLQSYLADTASARERDVQYIKHGTRNYRADFLVVVSIIIVIMSMCVVVTYDELSEFAKGSITTILGVFLNQLTNVFNFEFGTTRQTEENVSRMTASYTKK